MSPSLTTYSLPSLRSNPFSFAAALLYKDCCDHSDNNCQHSCRNDQKKISACHLTFIAFFIGAGIGLTALSMGRFAAGVFFAFIDLVRALPSTLMALLVIVGLGSGQWQLMAATGIAFSPLVAYVARSVYQREASREYVLAARSFGGSRMHILKLHLFPNIMGALITQLGIVLPRCIVTESVLSFLGLGSSPDEPTWGRMIADAAPMMERAPHEVIVPLCALVLLTFSLSLLANEWRERLDPIRRLERC